MRGMLMTLMVLATVIACTSVSDSQSRINLTLPNPNPFTEMLPVDFCEVTQNPHRYDGKLIRVRGVLWQHFEGAALLPNEPGSCWAMRAIRDCGEDCERLNAQFPIIKNGRLVQRSAVVVFGRFKYRRFITAEELRLGFSRFELQISRVEELQQLPDTPRK